MVHRHDWNDNSTPTYIRGKKKKMLRNSANSTGDQKHLLTFYKLTILTYDAEMIMLIFLYVLLTIFRDMRDNFAADIWIELGFGNKAAVFTQTEIPVTIIVLVLMASLVFIKNNFTAFLVAHIFIAVGFILSGVATWFFSIQIIDPATWMILVGIGLYMAYIPFNCMLYDRLIATFNIKGNTGFLMYCSDSFGYLGSALVLLTKEIFHIRLNWVSFFSNGIIVCSMVGVMGTLFSVLYFLNKHKKNSIIWNHEQPSSSEQVLPALQLQER